MSGYIKLHRRIRDNPLFRKNRNARLLFEDILLDAAWHDTIQDWSGNPINLTRGQLMMSQREMAEAYGISRQTVRTLLKSLVTHNMLKINPLPNQGPMIISVCNYDTYQGDQPTANPSANQPLTHLQPTKEEREEVKEERIGDRPELGDVEIAWQAYNVTAGACGLPKAQKLTKSRRQKIKARLAEHGIDGWNTALTMVERSGFLTGSNDRGWTADLDFLLRPEKLAKIIEGGFGNGRHAPPPKPAWQRTEAENNSAFLDSLEVPTWQ